MKRKALITGGNRGIGFAIAEGLVAEGLDVIIGSRDPAAGQEAAAKIGAGSAALDVADETSIAQAVETVGHVDVLINNAGVLGSGGILDDREDFYRSMAVMVEGPYELTRRLSPAMVEKGYGRIVNVSSGWGAFAEGLEGPAAYGVAKAALNALTVACARSLPDHVKVNAMCPGWVRTRMGGEGAHLSAQEGADTAIWLAMLDDSGPTGGFFRRRTAIDW